MSQIYTESHRSLQDEFDARDLADRLEAAILMTELGDDQADFIQSRNMLFLPRVLPMYTSAMRMRWLKQGGRWQSSPGTFRARTGCLQHRIEPHPWPRWRPPYRRCATISMRWMPPASIPAAGAAGPLHIAAHGPKLQALGSERADGIITYLMPAGTHGIVAGPDRSGSELTVVSPFLAEADPLLPERKRRKALQYYVTLDYYHRDGASSASRS